MGIRIHQLAGGQDRRQVIVAVERTDGKVDVVAEETRTGEARAPRAEEPFLVTLCKRQQGSSDWSRRNISGIG